MHRSKRLDGRLLPSSAARALAASGQSARVPGGFSQQAGDAVRHTVKEGDVYRPDGLDRERQHGRDRLSRTSSGRTSNSNGGGGAIKIGNTSSVLDNATIVANPGLRHQKPEVLIGDQVVIGFGARVVGPSVIGAYGSASQPTSIGAGALIDGAVIEPGAIVSPRARVGPGVTVPPVSGSFPGPTSRPTKKRQTRSWEWWFRSQRATSRRSSRPSRRMSRWRTAMSRCTRAARPPVSARAPARPSAGINNGNLAAILGANLQPGPTSASFEPAKTGPEFVTPMQGLVGVQLPNFHVEADGPGHHQHAGRAGRSTTLGGRMPSAPIKASRSRSGRSPRPASTSRSTRPWAERSPSGTASAPGSNVVILCGAKVNAMFGDNVTINSGAVVVQTSIGSNSTVGKGAYLANSTFPAHTVIPPNAIYVNNKFLGYVQW